MRYDSLIRKMCHSKHQVKQKRIYVRLLLFIKKNASYTKNEREANKKITYTHSLSSRHRSLHVRTDIRSFSLFLFLL